MKLYGHPGAPFVRKALVALEKKASLRASRSSSRFPREPELLALHPLGRSRCCATGDVVVPDSSVICAYLDKKHPPGALPRRPRRVREGPLPRGVRRHAPLRGAEGYPLRARREAVRAAAAAGRGARRGSARARGAAGAGLPRDRAPRDGDTLLARFSIADAALGAQLGSLTLAHRESTPGAAALRALPPGAARAPLVREGHGALAPGAEEEAMQYALLFYHPPPRRSRRRSAREPSWRCSRRCGLAGGARARRRVPPTLGLAGVEAATSLRGEGGEVLVSDGPFAETKEILGGLALIECADLDEALAGRGAAPSCGSGPSSAAGGAPPRA